MIAAGCAHLGPRTVAVDRFDYGSAIADSWKQQTLLNVVKLRYLDLPVFIAVASLVSSYSMQTRVIMLSLPVESLNGLRNRSTAGGGAREADEEFPRTLTLLRDVQTAGGFGMRVEEDKVKGSTGVVFFFTLSDTGQSERLPLITIPAQQPPHMSSNAYNPRQIRTPHSAASRSPRHLSLSLALN
jgi:hypothetical protein